MENAAHFAFPMPVRQAESVSSPASDAAETDERRRSVTSVSASPAVSDGYRSATTGRARTNSPTAQGAASATVTSTASAARRRASSSSPRDAHAATAGTDAATRP